MHFDDAKEIELIDLLRILFKRRYLIILVTLLSVGVAGAACKYMTDIFRVSMVLNTGFAGLDNNGNEINITKTDDLKAIIKSRVYERKIINGLYPDGGESQPESLDMTGRVLDGSKFVQVSCEIDDKSLGVTALNQVHGLLQEHYVKKVDTAIKRYIKEIEAVKNELHKNESEIAVIENKILQEKLKNKTEIAQIEHSISAAARQKKTINEEIDNAAEKIETIEKEIATSRLNTTSLIEKRDRFLEKSVTESNILSSMVYSNTVQQTIGYLNVLIESSSNYHNGMTEQKEKLAEKDKLIKDQSSKKESLVQVIKIVIENFQLEIKDLKDKQTDLISQISFFESQKESVSNILMIEPPLASKEPVRPKPMVAMAIAALFGIFSAVFFAFFMEYISANSYIDVRMTQAETGTNS
jgi:capsular polysaccharide biosynthesis protein